MDKYYQVGEKAVRFKSAMCTGYIIKMGLTSAILFIGGLFSLCLLTRGVNSYDQILLGYLMGTFISLIFHFGIKMHFINLPLYLSLKEAIRGNWMTL